MYVAGVSSHLSFYVDPYAGGLERRPVQRYAKDISLGCALFRSVDDIWQLRSLQSSRRYSCRRFLVGGRN